MHHTPVNSSMQHISTICSSLNPISCIQPSTITRLVHPIIKTEALYGQMLSLAIPHSISKISLQKKWQEDALSPWLALSKCLRLFLSLHRNAAQRAAYTLSEELPVGLYLLAGFCDYSLHQFPKIANWNTLANAVLFCSCSAYCPTCIRYRDLLISFLGSDWLQAIQSHSKVSTRA